MIGISDYWKEMYRTEVDKQTGSYCLLISAQESKSVTCDVLFKFTVSMRLFVVKRYSKNLFQRRSKNDEIEVNYFAESKFIPFSRHWNCNTSLL
ncbi:hypothetical protein EGR_10484 [Echinococcus granulosus]|uniref:Uncharacterized protein n=1 Tax=Echinococcus granulosus TaxID=6210 RepID=W6U294_ECHGR|nr:hypothetical protein EGR_10484 [Echinococcus granulosus]EUB54666.1 hypothetical protein EGR_10484 [Echinococcus granulosus]